MKSVSQVHVSIRIQVEAICESFMPAVLKKPTKISFRPHQLLSWIVWQI